LIGFGLQVLLDTAENRHALHLKEIIEELGIELSEANGLGRRTAEQITVERIGDRRRGSDRDVSRNLRLTQILDGADSRVAARDAVDHEYLVLLDQFLDRGQGAARREAIVLEDHLELAAVNAARVVDLLVGKLGTGSSA